MTRVTVPIWRAGAHATKPIERAAPLSLFQSPQDAMQLATEKEFCAWRPACGCDRHRPKISVSLGLILRSECASAGYVGDIQRDWKSCNIKYLRGGAERIRTSDLRTAKPRSALPLGDVACEFVSRTASRPDDEQLFSSVSNPQPSPQRDGSARLAAKMNGTERFARHDAAPTPDRLRAGFGLASS